VTIGGLFMLISRKSGWSTIVIIIIICVFFIVQNLMGVSISVYTGVYPLVLLLIMVIKRYQVKKTGLRISS
jgi:hypothetical protein